MDLTCYTEEWYFAMTKDYPDERLLVNPVPPVDLENDTPGPIELTDELNAKLFFNIDETPVLEAKFNGSGPVYKITRNGEIHILNTWSFTDLSGATWLLPKWLALDEPQGKFQGFKNEIPGEFIYYIEYHGTTNENGRKHNITVFRKLQ